MKRDDVAQKLNAISAYEEGGGVVRVLLEGETFNYNSIMTLADNDGNRLTDLEFDLIGHLCCGLLRVHVPGGKYGYVGVDGKFAIQPIYDDAQDFSDDVAWVFRDGHLYILDRSGNEVMAEPLPNGEYSAVEPFSEGLARVSILAFGGFWGGGNLAYYHDESANAGIWGYVNKSGKVVVRPQYIFAEDFHGGLAVVCKGEWTEHMPRRYWSDEMKWGALDMSGAEAIPCKFEEIKWRPWYPGHVADDLPISKTYLAAKDENDKWGIIDFKGNWIVPPQFGDVCYEFDTSPNGDMFLFYSRPIWGGGNPDDTPCGLYSISKQKVLVPADKYRDIEFVSDKEIKVSDNSQWTDYTNMPIPE